MRATLRNFSEPGRRDGTTPPPARRPRPLVQVFSLSVVGTLDRVVIEWQVGKARPPRRRDRRPLRRALYDRAHGRRLRRSRALTFADRSGPRSRLIALPPPMPRHDVLVIGAGLAGQRAALAAAETGVSRRHRLQGPPRALALERCAGRDQRGASTRATRGSRTHSTPSRAPTTSATRTRSRSCVGRPPRRSSTSSTSASRSIATRRASSAPAPSAAPPQARTYYVADITGQAIMHVLYEQLMRFCDAVDRYEEWFTTGLAMDANGAASAPSCGTSATARWRPSRRRT